MQQPNQNQVASEWLRKLFRPPERTQDPSVVEEQDRIIQRASRYDALESLSAWGDILEYMMSLVNTEIVAATKDPELVELQRIHIIRWNAMRELLDGVLAEVKDTRKERDRILQERNADGN